MKGEPPAVERPMTKQEKRDRRNGKLNLTLIGDRIAYARQQRHLTQQRLAEKMDIDNWEKISRIETGSRSPSIWDVIDLAEALEISTDFILLGTNNPFQVSDEDTSSD